MACRPSLFPVVLAGICTFIKGGLAANASEPHPHRGVIPRLKLDGRPNVKLTAADWKVVDSGELWMSSKEVASVGRGIGIQDIKAPMDVVFDQISNLAGYVGKVPFLKSIKVYDSKSHGNVLVEKATYTLRVIPGFNYEYFLEHHVKRKGGSLLFHLDYDQHSDFNDMQGKWYLEVHPTKPGWTRLYYQCDLALWGFAPEIVKKLLTSQGLASAIGWVKRESEKEAKKGKIVPSNANTRSGNRAASPQAFAFFGSVSLNFLAGSAATIYAAARIVARRPRCRHLRVA